MTDGLRLIEDTKPDLVFLDIEIEGGTSFEELDDGSIDSVGAKLK